MNPVRHGALLAATLTLATAGSVSAQAAPAPNNGCTIDVNKLPKAAQTAYGLLDLKGTSEVAKKAVREGLRAISDPGDKSDPLAKSYFIGRTMVWYGELQNGASMAKRADLGLAGPGDQVDIYATMDTAFANVERLQPKCASETEPYRQYLWAKAVNAAVPLINADKLDSAETYLQRANGFYPSQPHGYFYESFIASKKKDLPGAVAALKKALELSTPELVAKDSGVKQIRRDALLNLGVAYSNQADQASDASAKSAAAKQAAESFKMYLTEFPNAEDAKKVQDALTRAQVASGDSTAINAAFADMLKDPKKYSEAQLIAAGARAFNDLKDRKLAAQYFEAALTVNPNSRDALFNVTNMYNTLAEYDKVVTSGKKLVEIDPNYPETWHMLGYAFQELGNKSKDAKLKKEYADSARIYAAREKKLAARVRFSGFDHDGAKHTLQGTVENLTKTPKNFTLSVEFLDAQGNVIATKDTPVSTTAGGKTPFTLEVQKEGVVAFRYKPLA